MKQRGFFILLIFIVFLLVGCYTKEQEKKPLSFKNEVTKEIPSKAKEEKKQSIKLSNNNKKSREKSRDSNLIASYSATLPNPILNERYNISLASKYLNGAVVRPGETFSLNQRIGKRSLERGFKLGPMYINNRISPTVGGGVCKIASVIYNVAVLANQKIVTRYPHSMTVPYVPPGRDATISYGTKDFKFKNITNSLIKIRAVNKEGTLTISFHGNYKAPKVKWHHKTKMKGAVRVVHSWVTIYNGHGKIIKDMGISRYNPHH